MTPAADDQLPFNSRQLLSSQVYYNDCQSGGRCTPNSLHVPLGAGGLLSIIPVILERNPALSLGTLKGCWAGGKGVHVGFMKVHHSMQRSNKLEVQEISDFYP